MSIPEVRWFGSLRGVLGGGDLSSHGTLRDLADRPHLYALGPVAGLRGEITVLDGVATVARVRNGEILIERTTDVGACFLAYAAVSRWRETRLSVAVVSETDLAEWFARLPAPTPPFVFVIRGTPAALHYHVIDKADAAPHDPTEHARAKVHFELRERPVAIVGFCAPNHRGVFIPEGQTLHMHFVSDDGRASGHIDAMRLRPGAVLSLQCD